MDAKEIASGGWAHVLPRKNAPLSREIDFSPFGSVLIWGMVLVLCALGIFRGNSKQLLKTIPSSLPGSVNQIVFNESRFPFASQPVAVPYVTVNPQPKKAFFDPLQRFDWQRWNHNTLILPLQKSVELQGIVGRNQQAIKEDREGIVGNRWQVQGGIIFNQLITALRCKNLCRHVTAILNRPPKPELLVGNARLIVFHGGVNDQPRTLRPFLDFDSPRSSFGRNRSLAGLFRQSQKSQDECPRCYTVWPSKSAIPTWKVPLGIGLAFLAVFNMVRWGNLTGVKIYALCLALLACFFILTGYESCDYKDCGHDNYVPNQYLLQHNSVIVPHKSLDTI